jgi:hypothetical protein
MVRRHSGDGLRVARERLLEYGYGLRLSDGLVLRASGLPTGVFLSGTGGRLVARTQDGGKLWSGSDVGQFLERYWYAKKIPPAPRSGPHPEDLLNERDAPDDFGARDRVRHISILETSRGFRVHVKLVDIQALQAAGDQEALRMLRNTFPSFDLAHDAGQAMFRHATASS